MSFVHHFCSQLTPVALPVIPKVEFNFKVIMYITIFLSQVWNAALILHSAVKTYLISLQSSFFFLWQLREKNFTRKVWGLCTPWSSILRPPKHWFIFPFYFKTQRSYFSALGMKTRPWKFKIWPATRHDYQHFPSARF